MDPASFTDSGGMPTGAKPHGQIQVPQKNESNQVLINHVAEALQSQGPFSGWRAEFPIKDRAFKVYQMINSLRLVQPKIDMQNAAQTALSFEQKAFRNAREKSDYEKDYTDKLIHIRDTRARQAAAMQGGMAPQAELAPGMPGIGQNQLAGAFPQQMNRPVQASPISGQPQLPMGVNDPHEQTALQQQQQPILQRQQRAQQRPGGNVQPDPEKPLKFDSRWELPALTEQISDTEKHLLSLVTLTRTESSVKVMTCERYIQETYGDSGIELIRNVVRALKSCDRVYSDGTMKIEARMDHVRASFAEPRSKHWNLLLWLCLTFRLPTAGSVCLSTIERRGQTITLAPLSPIKIISEGAHCWCELFQTAIVVHEPDLRAHPGQESWLDMDFNLLIQLAAVEYPLRVDSGLVLMGYSTALVPVQEIDDQTVLWHLEVARHDSQLRATELAAVHGPWLQNIDFEILRLKRALLGWCPKAITLLGTKNAKPDVRWSDATAKRTTWHWNGANLQFLAQSAAPLQVGGQAGMSFNRSINTLQFSQANNFRKCLRSSALEQIIIYDVGEKRCWLVPLICAFHQMLFSYWKTIPEGSRELDIPLAEPASDGALASFAALKDNGGRIVEGNQGDKLTIRDLILGFSVNLSKASSQPPRRSELYGYEFMDIVMDSTKSELKRKHVSRAGLTWLPLLREVNCLFCSHLGDAVIGLRADEPNSPCNQLPIGFDWMATSVRSLNALSLKQGRLTAGMAHRLSSDHFWFPTGEAFKRCDHGVDSEVSCWRSSPMLQEIQNESSEPKDQELERFPDGAVVFGRQRPTMRLPRSLLNSLPSSTTSIPSLSFAQISWSQGRE